MKIQRVWAMPNANTFLIQPIHDIIYEYIQKLPGEHIIIDPYANTNKLATITNDIVPDYDTDFNMEAKDF